MTPGGVVKHKVQGLSCVNEELLIQFWDNCESASAYNGDEGMLNPVFSERIHEFSSHVNCTIPASIQHLHVEVARPNPNHPFDWECICMCDYSLPRDQENISLIFKAVVSGRQRSYRLSIEPEDKLRLCGR